MLEFHPLANLFPLIEGAAFDELVADVKANGLREPIVMFELGNQILDGRNRFRAAVAAGVIDEDDIDYVTDGGTPVKKFTRFFTHGGGDPLAWVLSKNLHRRHLTDSQRSIIAADIANLKQGRPSEWNRPREGEDKSANWRDSEVSIPDAAEMLNVSERSVQRGRQVVEHAAPEVVESVRRGDIAISAAANLSELPVSQQLEILRSADPRAVSRIAKERRAEQQEVKRDRRDERAAELAQKHQALPVVKAGIIVADPAWRDEEVWSADTGMDRAADNHYPTQTLAQVMDLDIGALAADDCMLFLWCKTNNLIDAFCVAMAAGFCVLGHDEAGRIVPIKSGARYVSEIAWDKEVIGNGRWVRDRHEHLLIFRRGNPVAPAPGTQLPSVLNARKSEHSAKPEAVLEWIDRVWPGEVKIELNRRGPARPGWLAWGNEAEGNSPEIPDSSPHPQTAVDADIEAQEQIELGAVAEVAANQLIREGYARNAPLSEIAAATGLGVKAIQKRAKRMDLTSTDRQRAAVSEANRHRTKSREE